ncbi:MAG: FtsX-like permease family protein [Candidatus Methylomirabilales bacterium]
MRKLLHLLRLVSWRTLTRDRTRSLVTLLGVALGVTAVLAVRLANEAVLTSFERSLEHVAGKSRLVVSAGEPGVDEDLFPTVAAAPGVAKAVPVIQAVTPVEGRPGDALLVLGVDILADGSVREYEAGGVEDPLRLLTEPDAILLTERYAGRHGIRVGDRLGLLVPAGARGFTVRGLLRDRGAARFMDGRAAVMDIAAAQLHLGKLGRLDRIDLLLGAGADPGAVAAALRGALPAGVRVERPEARNAQVEEMLGAFQLNLFVLSLVALFVGAFLVYNTMSVSVVRQRRQLAILRSLGVSRRGILLVVAGEGLLLGLLGSLLGAAAGLALSRATLGAVARTVSSLYAFVRPEPADISLALLAPAVLLGCAMAVAASLPAALEASAVSPREGLAAASLERRHRPWRISALGLLLAAAAYGLAQAGPVGGRPLFGYAAAFSLLVAAALLCPLLLLAAQSALAPAPRGPLAAWLAGRSLGRSRRRAAVTVGAMVVGLAMLVGVSTMIQSFRRTVESWIDQSVRADLYLSRVSRLTPGADSRLPASVVGAARSTPGVAEVDGLRALHVSDGRGPFAVVAGDLEVLARRGRLLFRRGDGASLLREARERGAVVVSETFAERRGVREGDHIELAAGRPVSLAVLGVYHDYTTEGGVVIMDRTLFRRLWDDAWVTSVAIYLAPGADPEAVRDGLQARLGRQDLLIVHNRALRRRILDLFDQTFAITYALEVVALVVAALGILNTLIAAVLERTREIGVLRAVGFSRPRVVAMILAEAGYLGLLATLLGSLAGLALSLVLIHVINKQSFGWSIQFWLPVRTLIGYGLLTLAASLLAGALPAWRAARIRVAEAVRYE